MIQGLGEFFLALAAIFLIPGVLHVWAGVLNLKYRGRGLGYWALWVGGVVGSNLVICFPTALGLLIYGLMVYGRPEVVEAFEMGEAGSSPEEILRSSEK